MTSVPPTEGNGNAEDERREHVRALGRALSAMGWPGYAIESFTSFADGYAPSEEAIVAGRILDGEARTSWELVSNATTDEDLKRAAQLIGAIADACRAGDRSQLDQLDAAARAFHNQPSNDEERRAHFVMLIGAWVAHWRDGRRADPSQLVDQLANIDRSFADTTPERARACLLSILSDEETLLQAAASLAVEAKALGLRERASDAREGVDPIERARHALNTAQRRASR